MESLEKAYIIKKREEKLLRKGSLLNTLGVLRSAIIYNGCIERNQYVQIINRNFMISPEYHDPNFETRINMVWNTSREKLLRMNLLDPIATTENKICLIKKVTQIDQFRNEK